MSQNKIVFFLQQSWLLLVSAFIFGLLLAATNAAWNPIIQENKVKKLNQLMSSLVTDANSFELAVEGFEITSEKGKILKTDIYKAIDLNGNKKGFAFTAIGSGFADKIELVIAADSNFEKLLGYNVLSSNETPGFGNKIKEMFYRDQFIGAPVGTLRRVKIGNASIIDDEIVAITGATISSDAVIAIFNLYTTAIKKELLQKGLISDGR